MSKRLAFLLVVLLSGVASAQPIPDEVAALKERIKQLEARVAELEKQKTTRPPRAAPVGQAIGPDRDALSHIALPDNPTFEQIQDYMQQIMDLTQDQQMFGPNDPQVTMLAKVGEKNLPALLQLGQYQLTFYVTEAIKRIATDASKQQIIDALPTMPDLASVIIARKWVAEAREPLLALLQNRGAYISPYVFQAIISLHDPSTYPAMIDAFISSPMRVMTYEYLRQVPDIDLTEAVPKAWEMARGSFEPDNWERRGMALIAAEYGQLDALEESLGAVQSLDVTMRMRLLRILPKGVTLADAPAWLKTNRAVITFDPKKRMYASPSATTRP